MTEHPSDSAQHRQAIQAIAEGSTHHVVRHVTNRQVRDKIMGTSPVGRFNNMLAVSITRAVGTMWAAYLFVLIAIVSFPQALTAFLNGDTVTGITWLSQSFLQLVLLPIIIVGQNVIAVSQDERAEADHETLTALHTLNVRQLHMLEQQAKILAMLKDHGA